MRPAFVDGTGTVLNLKQLVVNVLSSTDLLLFVLAGAALAAPVAHLVIAYWYAPKKISRWLESPSGLQLALGKALPTLGESFSQWAHTPEGDEFLGQLVEAIVQRGTEEAKRMMARASGHATQSARAPWMSLLGGIKTGNSMIDGAWAMVAPQILPKIAPMLGRALPDLVAQAQAQGEGPPEG